MITVQQQITDAVAGLGSPHPSQRAMAAGDLVRILGTKNVTLRAFADGVIRMVSEEAPVIEATPSPVDAIPAPQMPRRVPLLERTPTTPRIATAQGIKKSILRRGEQSIRRDDPRFDMVCRVAVDLIADGGDRMNALSLDMARNISEWRGGEITLKQVRWLAKTEAALQRRVT